eukprot:COSAG02_NODE_59114_length_275_cov_0.590909_1_plen_46_part_01
MMVRACDGTVGAVHSCFTNVLFMGAKTGQGQKALQWPAALCNSVAS